MYSKRVRNAAVIGAGIAAQVMVLLWAAPQTRAAARLEQIAQTEYNYYRDQGDLGENPPYELVVDVAAEEFLTSSVKITVWGGDLRIKRLHGKYGTIENDTAGAGQDGADGESVELITRPQTIGGTKYYGGIYLERPSEGGRIHVYGQHGGAGNKTNRDGGSGGDGGDVYIESCADLVLCESILSIAGQGGAGDPGTPVPSTLYPWFQEGGYGGGRRQWWDHNTEAVDRSATGHGCDHCGHCGIVLRDLG